MATTAFGLLGVQLDRGFGARRWEHWRPTISMFQHDDLLIHRFVLAADPAHAKLVQRVVADIRQASPETSVEVVDLPLDDPWDFEEVYGALYDLAGMLDFAEDDEHLVHITTGTHVAQICLFLLCESRRMPAKLLQTGPPRPGVGNDAGTWSVIDLDLQRYDRIAARHADASAEATTFLKQGISTQNDRFNTLIGRIEQVALASDAPILLTGPTGAGKSQLARRIHALRTRRRKLDGPLVDVNCATLRGDAAMSTLFGHVRGAYTGAEADRPGLLLAADGGTLFLDEIGELGPDEQAMLLHALEHQTWRPVGADHEVQARFQLIAGSNRDLRDDARQGRFRADLLARIDLWHFDLPGLADRPEDIEPNVDYELDRWAERTGDHVVFNREARRRFLHFATQTGAAWHGNFRDLHASVTRLATLSAGRRIDVPLVDEEIARLNQSWSAATTTPAARVAKALGVEGAAGLDRFDLVQLEEVLAVCETAPSLSAAGRTLFAVSRTRRKTANDADRLRKYLQKFGLTWHDVQG